VNGGLSAVLVSWGVKKGGGGSLGEGVTLAWVFLREPRGGGGRWVEVGGEVG